jgi:folate-binding protein YgfZ
LSSALPAPYIRKQARRAKQMTRKIYAISGADRVKFLQGLVTNNVTGEAGITYAALLSPQGKYLADFFLITEAERILIDLPEMLAADTVKRLGMYKLRADVQITETALRLSRGIDAPPQNAWPDPRYPALGWRAYGKAAHQDTVDWDAIRVKHVIPKAGYELIPNESYILEMGFERLNGVDFRKGCYVGQEVTARMKHKTTLRKGLAKVTLSALVPYGTPITAQNKTIGQICTTHGQTAIAYLRFDQATGEIHAGQAAVHIS